MADDIARLSRDLERIDSLLADIAAERKLEEEALALIESDLSNTVEEFVADTQRSPEDYHAWRRKAKLARLHKQRRLAQLDERRKDAEADRARVQMLLLATRSGYRGSDPLRLLDATLLLLLDVVERAKVTLDEQETGLVVAARLACGYGVPGERVRQ